MEREDFNKQEKKAEIKVKTAIILLCLYSVSKMLCACAILCICNNCDLKSESILNVFLYADLVVMTLVFAYFLYVIFSLVRHTYYR